VDEALPESLASDELRTVIALECSREEFSCTGGGAIYEGNARCLKSLVMKQRARAEGRNCTQL
jgi:hypothetical protein